MTERTLFILLFVAIVVGSTALIMYFRRFFVRMITKNISKDKEAIETAINSLDAIISTTTERLNVMLPQSQVAELDSKIKTLKKSLETSREGLAGLQEKLSSLQEKISLKERAHAEIKKGRTQSIQLADELQANKELLLSELNELQNQLADSKAQLDSLNEEFELTEAQKNSIQEIKGSLDSSKQQLHELSSAYNHASKSFITLESQYQELEKEYRRLIEVELGRGRTN